MNKMSSTTTTMKICDVCNGKVREKSYQQQLKSPKQFHNLGQIGKVIVAYVTLLFSPKQEKHFQSDKHLDKTGQKIRCDESQIIYDRNHGSECRKIGVTFARHITIFSIKKT